MHTCDFKHEEIVYVCNSCPMCAISEDFLSTQKTLIEMEEDFEEFRYEHYKLVGKVKEHSPELLI